MFTGIIEEFGTIRERIEVGKNISFRIESPLAPQLRPEESISHNGICLTVEEKTDTDYRVTAVAETLAKTNAGDWTPGTKINLERAMLWNARLDGHIVQGHVDDVATCIAKRPMQGSTEFTFSFDMRFAPLMIEKGSVCLNGVSLTAFNVKTNEFSVTIIPYTMEHTNFHTLKTGDRLNIEFDVLGKYVQRNLALRR